MIKAYVKIKNLEDILTLNRTSKSCDYNLVLFSGSKILNPKSLMMLFELKVGNTFPLVAKISEYEEKERFLKKFGDLIVSYSFY